MRWSNPLESGRRRVVFSRETKDALLRAQGGRCAYCGSFHRPRYLEVDHKHPFSRGGSDQIDNLQLLCIACNLRKGIQDDGEFRARYRWLLPADRSIPSPPIPQESFSAETRRTRAARPVRSIYRQRFTAARRRRSIRYGLLVAAVLAFALAIIVLTS